MTYQWHLLRQRHLERRVRESGDRLSITAEPSTNRAPHKQQDITHVIRIVHCKGDALAFEIIHIQRSRFAAALWRIDELERPRPRGHEIRRAILVSERMATYDDRLYPSRYGPGDTFEDDGLAEYSTSEDIADLRANFHCHVRSEMPKQRMDGRTVPFGERHICLRLNSFTRASSGVIVAHLIPTLYLRIASADSIVTWSLVYVEVGCKGTLSGRSSWGLSETVLHRGARDRDQNT